MECIKIGPALGIEDSDFTIEYKGLCVENNLVKIDFCMYEEKIQSKYNKSKCSESRLCCSSFGSDDKDYINPNIIALPFSLEKVSIENFDKCGNMVQMLKFAEFKIKAIGYDDEGIVEKYKEARKKILESPIKVTPV